MTIDLGWVIALVAVAFVAGIAVTLVTSAFLATTPMDGRTYTGDLPPGLRSPDDP